MEENYFDEEMENDVVPISPWRRALQVVAGSIFIVALLYFSGIYQYFLFSQTPDMAEPDSHEQLISGRTIEVPTAFYVIGGTERDEDDVLELSRKASDILSQAGVVLAVAGVYKIEMSEANILNALDDEAFLKNLPSYDSKVVTVILSRSLLGLNGVAFGRGGVVAVAEYTSGYDFRTLAHEMGHVLGLGHTENLSRLMNSGGRGEVMTKTEAETVRENARRFESNMLK